MLKMLEQSMQNPLYLWCCSFSNWEPLATDWATSIVMVIKKYILMQFEEDKVFYFILNSSDLCSPNSSVPKSVKSYYSIDNYLKSTTHCLIKRQMWAIRSVILNSGTGFCHTPFHECKPSQNKWLNCVVRITEKCCPEEMKDSSDSIL